MQNIKLKKMVRGLGAAAAAATFGVALAGAKPAAAQTTTFAQYLQKNNGNPYSYVNSGVTSGPNSTFSASLPVYFLYQVPNGYGSNGLIDATLSFTSTVSAPATLIGSDYKQGFKTLSLVFTATTPNNGFSNLLTVTSTTALFNGSGGSASLNASTPADNVVFSSDFLNFSNTTVRNFALTFSSITPPLSLDLNGYLRSFTAAGNGTFASNPPPTSNVPMIPEAGTLPLSAAAGSVSLLGLLASRRRRRTASR